jgi:acetoin:2,6-dichlorophenolindophenol oxidoreductase subunit beta
MKTVLNSLNAGLHKAMAADESVVLLGEDVLDPYGGAFKVTQGLSSAFPGRVLSTPISEAGIVGMAAGMALRGLRPVVEIMFGDFVTLAADQLINHASKYRSMYNEQVRVPMVVRTPMGGRRGYGPTHSQSLEKLYLGVPGLQVLAPCALALNPDSTPGELLVRAILHNEDPVLFIENKLLYLLPLQREELLADLSVEILLQQDRESSRQPTAAYRVRVKGAPPPTMTIAAYGYMAHLAQKSLVRLAYQREIFAELLVLTQLAPVQVEPIVDSVRRTGRLLTVEEGSLSSGWGAEVTARTAEALGRGLKASRRLAAQETAIPSSGPLEAAVLPGEDALFEAACRLAQTEG